MECAEVSELTQDDLLFDVVDAVNGEYQAMLPSSDADI